MARRSPQTQAKRAREVALRERRERKREKKNQTADERAAARGGTEFDAFYTAQAEREAPPVSPEQPAPEGSAHLDLDRNPESPERA